MCVRSRRRLHPGLHLPSRVRLLFFTIKLKKKIWFYVTSQAYSGIFKREVVKQIQTAFCELRINHSLIYVSLLFWSVSTSNAVHFKGKKKIDVEPQWREVALLYNRLCHLKNVSIWPWMHAACIMHTLLFPEYCCTLELVRGGEREYLWFD